MQKLAETKVLNSNGTKRYPNMFGVQIPTWKGKYNPNNNYENSFFFDWRKGAIAIESLEDLQRNYKVNLIPDLNFDFSYDIWEVPEEYKTSFQQNPEKAKRDF
jgi:hypothetical protein